MPQILIDYIKQNGLAVLETNFFITAKRHSKYPNLVLLKYSQIESDFSNPIVRLCRGIILDEANNWKPVCFGYRKFANYGESYADKIDWSNARVAEKLDGSLIQLFYYDNQWLVATSGTPDAGGSVGDFGFTFAELFWRVWKEKGYQLPTDINCCYAFELCGKYNRIVVQHKEERIVLHGGRNLNTFRELDPIVEAHNYGWEVVKTFPFTSIGEVLAETIDMKGIENEGFVVIDTKNYNRVKIKAQNYIALSHLKDSVDSSKRQLLEIARKNEFAVEKLLKVRQDCE